VVLEVYHRSQEWPVVLEVFTSGWWGWRRTSWWGGGRCAPLAATLSTMASYAAEVQRQAREAARLLQDQASCGH